MFLTLLPPSVSSSLLLLLACTPATEPVSSGSSKDNQPPPGMVFLEKESVTIGTEDDAVKDLIISHDGGMMSVWGETPKHKLTVDDFYLMTTEVTNEQFAEYVKAAGSLPPSAWGRDAIEKATREFLVSEGKKREEARAAGEPVPPKETFDPDGWWKENWEKTAWEVPKDLLSLPVVEVNHYQAEAYARWAGLRLMTEFEFQRAVRGKTDNLYPWGSKWEPDKVVCAENAKDRLPPVGSRPEGATADGIYDLPGSVWEWTSSKYIPYPNHKTSTVKIASGSRSRVEPLIVEWDESDYVVVGGAFQNGEYAARCTTRQGEWVEQTTNGTGFRCAASPEVGFDISRLIEKVDVPRSIRSNHKFDMSLTVAMDRWKYRPGEAGERIKNYAVITDYDYVLFTPVAELKTDNANSLGRATVTDGPLILGFLSTTLPLTSPPLEPGTYVVGWRGEGENRTKEGDEDEDKKDDDEETEAPKRPLRDFDVEFDYKLENLVFYDKNGTPMLAYPFAGVESKKLQAGTIAVSEIKADEKKEIEAHDEIVIGAAVPAGRRGLFFDIKLECAAGTISGNWRKQN